MVLFAVIGTYGIVLWFLYNLIIFHDPLYFLHSAYSAQAINEAQAQFAGTKGDAWTSILTYGWDMIGILGAPVLIAGGVSSIMLLAIRHPERKRTIFTLALLGAPVLFEFVSLYVGQTTIRVPQLFPYGMWNDRYGIMALPFCAVAIGVLVDRWRWTVGPGRPRHSRRLSDHGPGHSLDHRRRADGNLECGGRASRDRGRLPIAALPWR